MPVKYNGQWYTGEPAYGGVPCSQHHLDGSAPESPGAPTRSVSSSSRGGSRKASRQQKQQEEFEAMLEQEEKKTSSKYFNDHGACLSKNLVWTEEGSGILFKMGS